MKKVFTFFLFLLVMGMNSYAQTMVAVSSNVFTPADITIEVGETVQWDNMGGTHNVNGSTTAYPSNPEGFANGAASSMAWTFSHTFTTPGTYTYHCDPHQGLGMIGTVTVNMPAVLTNGLVIAGVYDAQPAASGAKGLELYAVEDIADLSTFGVGSANNGGGSDGEEFTFPAVSVTAGTCLFITNDSMAFADFFGFNADYVNGSAAGVNGDDAIELFENGTVIDVFGDIDVDGNGEVWEYLDGWAYRKSGTGPDGSTFDANNWTYSGVDALQGGATNADAPVPYTNCTYSPMPPAVLVAMDDNATTDINTLVNINVLMNDVLPNGSTSVTVDMAAANGMATVNAMDGTIDYMPTMDYCGADMFTYIVCDATSACDTATVTLDITCPTVYPQVPIADVTTVSGITGIADSLGRPFEITGIVYGVDLQGADDAIQFTIIDKFNATAGLGLFSGGGATFGYTVNEGDEIVVQGVISQFRGLTQINPDTIWTVSTDNALHDPLVVTGLGEANESMLVKFENMKYVDVTEWAPGGAGFNVRITDGSTDTIAMRIDNDVDLFNMMAPDFGLFNVTGIVGQFTFNPENFDGYQFLPRYVQDIDEIVSVIDPTISEKVSIAPNPVSETLFVSMTEQMERLNITNVLGQAVRTIENPTSLEEINVANLPSGMYVLTFVNGDRIWSTQFVKK